MAFFLEELRLEGIELISIQGCEITSQMGEHGRLYLSAYIEDDQQLLYHRDQNQPLHLYVQKRAKEITLFYGIITQLEITCSGGSMLLVLEARTLSYLMDIEKRSRSFQHKEALYSEIVGTVLAEHQVNYHFCATDREIGEWLIQYEETDWQFLQRVVSSLGVSLTPAADYEHSAVYIGIPDTEAAAVPYEIILMNKDMLSYHYHEANGYEVYPVNYTRYQIKSPVMAKLFDRLIVSGTDFSIISSSYYFIQGQMVCQYLLQKKEGVLILPVDPMQMVGIALPGTIIGVNADQVQVHLAIDPVCDPATAYWIPYSTVSAAADGTGWYCMPEIGDLANVYFPCKELSQAIALNAVNAYPQPTSGEDRMGNVNRVYLSTIHDKKIILDEDRIKIASDGESTAVEILGDGTIALRAADKVKLIATQDIELFAEQRVEFRAVEASAVTNESLTSSITVDSKGAVLLTGTDILVD